MSSSFAKSVRCNGKTFGRHQTQQCAIVRRANETFTFATPTRKPSLMRRPVIASPSPNSTRHNFRVFTSENLIHHFHPQHPRKKPSVQITTENAPKRMRSATSSIRRAFVRVAVTHAPIGNPLAACAITRLVELLHPNEPRATMHPTQSSALKGAPKLPFQI